MTYREINLVDPIEGLQPVNEIQEEEILEEQEVQLEESTPEEEVEVEEQEIEEVQEFDDTDATESAIILDAFIKSGEIEYDDTIKKDLSGNELMQILKDNAYKEVERNYQDKLIKDGFTPEIKESIEFLRNGGTLEELQNRYKVQSLSEIDIDDDYDLSNREKLIKAYHKEMGLSDKKSESLYNLSLDNDETYEDALEAKNYFTEKDAALIEQKKKENQLVQQQQEELKRKNKEIVDNILDSGTINGIEISKQEANNIRKALSDLTISVDYKDSNGKIRTAKITKYEAKLQEYENNPEWQLLFTKLLLDDFKLDKIENKIRLKRDREVLDGLNGRLGQRKAISRNQNENNGGTFKSTRFVGEIDI